MKLCGTATADSEQASASRGNHPATDGNDGNMTTRWTAADGALGHYWTLDMGCEQSPVQVVIYWEYPAADYTDPYGIVFQISHDGQAFTSLFSVEQSGLPVTIDVVALAAANTSGTGAGGASGGAGGASGGADGLDTGGAGGSSDGGMGSALDGGGASSGAAGGDTGGNGTSAGDGGGIADSGGIAGSGGTTGNGNQPWDGKARYIRIQVTKLPPVVNSKQTWAGFFELQVYANAGNACGVACP